MLFSRCGVRIANSCAQFFIKYRLHLCFHFHFPHQRHFVQLMMKRHKKVIILVRIHALRIYVIAVCLVADVLLSWFASGPSEGCSRWQFIGKRSHAIVIGIEQIGVQLARNILRICDFCVLDAVKWLKVLMIDNRSDFLPLYIFHKSFFLQNSRW